MLTVDDVMALRQEGKTIPYLTMGEAMLLADEIARLRVAASVAWEEGAKAMQTTIVERLRHCYDAGAHGIAGSVSLDDAKVP